MRLAVISDIHGNSWALKAVNCGIKNNRPDWAKWLKYGRV
jgi:predicted phosphodiesterase